MLVVVSDSAVAGQVANVSGGDGHAVEIDAAVFDQVARRGGQEADARAALFEL